MFWYNTDGGQKLIIPLLWIFTLDACCPSKGCAKYQRLSDLFPYIAYIAQTSTCQYCESLFGRSTAFPSEITETLSPCQQCLTLCWIFPIQLVFCSLLFHEARIWPKSDHLFHHEPLFKEHYYWIWEQNRKDIYFTLILVFFQISN